MDAERKEKLDFTAEKHKEALKMLSEDPINPDWYDCPGGELINVLKLVLTPEEWRGYCKGNIFKYVIRAPNKNKAEDFNKGIKYIEFLRDGGLNE